MKILDKNDKNAKMVRIQNTLNINKIKVSNILLKSLANNKNIEIIGEVRRLKTDKVGNLLP